ENAVSRVLHEEDAPKPKDQAPEDPKEAEYQRRHVGFYTHVTVNLITGQAWGNWGGPYLGNGNTPLEPPDYFKHVGRYDLADYYRSQSHKKAALGATGGILLAAGFVTALSSVAAVNSGFCQEQDPYGLCIKRDMTTLYAMVGAGLGALTIGIIEVVFAAKTQK